MKRELDRSQFIQDLTNRLKTSLYHYDFKMSNDFLRRDAECLVKIYTH